MTADTLLLLHLGLGDVAICNAIVRAAVKTYGKVSLPVKASNMESVAFMFRDLDGLNLIAVPDSFHRNGGEVGLIEMAKRHGGCVQNLTMFERGRFDQWVSDEETCFDTNFYRWAGMEMSEKFTGFHVERDRSIELPVPEGDYAFTHDTPDFPMWEQPTVRAMHAHSFNAPNIFSLWGIIENAAEIHVINSSFLNVIDLAMTPKGRLVWHKYARKEVSYPTLRLPWEILI